MPKRKKHNMSQASLDNLRPGEYKFTKEDSAKGISAEALCSSCSSEAPWHEIDTQADKAV